MFTSMNMGRFKSALPPTILFLSTAVPSASSKKKRSLLLDLGTDEDLSVA